MSASNAATIASSFIEHAPPGELADVVADIKALTADDPKLVESLGPAFENYNQEQLTTVKLPGGSNEVIVSSHNTLEDGRFYDVATQTSFAFDHITHVGNTTQTSHDQPLTGFQESFGAAIICARYEESRPSGRSRKSLLKNLSAHSKEHYPNAACGVYPVEDDSSIAIVLVSNKYNPHNFWNGRWRSQYIYSPSNACLTGNINVDVHYYENGNVRLLTNKPVNISVSSSASASEIIRQIAGTERRYHEELNRGFGNLSEGAFKGLRRQLPVTRQKIEWEKISSYRLGQDIGGGKGR